MKKILFTVALCALTSATFAQKKAVKEAKSSLGSKNYTEARALIKPALTNPETANDPETWKVAGDIENTVFEQERNNEMFGKEFNQPVMYEALMATYRPYIIADSLAQLPDEKGKVKNKVRKDIAGKMLANQLYFRNGGVYYNDKEDYNKSVDFFSKYLEIPSLDMVSGEKVNIDEKDFQVIKYYAATRAVAGKNYDVAISKLTKIVNEPFVENDLHNLGDVYETLAGTYLESGDTIQYASVLEVGANKYPAHHYFLPRLINQYIADKKYSEAIDYLDTAIKNNPESFCDLVSTKGNLYSQLNEYEKADIAYNEALAKDPSCEKSIEGLSVSYLLQARNIKDKASTASIKERASLDDQAKSLYKKALPLLLQYKDILNQKGASNNDKANAEYRLLNAYYHLDMSAEYEAANKEYERLSKE